MGAAVRVARDAVAESSQRGVKELVPEGGLGIGVGGHEVKTVRTVKIDRVHSTWSSPLTEISALLLVTIHAHSTRFVLADVHVASGTAARSYVCTRPEVEEFLGCVTREAVGDWRRDVSIVFIAGSYDVRTQTAVLVRSCVCPRTAERGRGKNKKKEQVKKKERISILFYITHSIL